MVKATKSQIEEFKTTLVWEDFKAEIQEWREGLILELLSISEKISDTTSTPSVLVHLGHVNGRIKSADYLLSLPDILISSIEIKKKEEENRCL